MAAGAVAAAVHASDVYIFGTATGRVAGTNDATVNVRWAFKCLGDKLGEAKYEYTLVAVRLAPTPEKRVTIGPQTTKTGSTTVRLSTGSWQLRGDPFLCETERGAGANAPEIGEVVKVPDFCTWTVQKAKGGATLETVSSVKAAKQGAVVVPGTSVVTAAGPATIGTAGRDATLALDAKTKVTIDRKQCYSRSGWRVALGTGGIAATTKGSDGKSAHDVDTSNATVSAKAARWSVKVTRKGAAVSTVVRVSAGAVSVKGSAGAPVIVKAGLSTTVSGSSAATKPAH